MYKYLFININNNLINYIHKKINKTNVYSLPYNPNEIKKEIKYTKCRSKNNN